LTFFLQRRGGIGIAAAWWWADRSYGPFPPARDAGYRARPSYREISRSPRNRGVIAGGVVSDPIVVFALLGTGFCRRGGASRWTKLAASAGLRKRVATVSSSSSACFRTFRRDRDWRWRSASQRRIALQAGRGASRTRARAAVCGHDKISSRFFMRALPRPSDDGRVLKFSNLFLARSSRARVLGTAGRADDASARRRSLLLKRVSSAPWSAASATARYSS